MIQIGLPSSSRRGTRRSDLSTARTWTGSSTFGRRITSDARGRSRAGPRGRGELVDPHHPLRADRSRGRGGVPDDEARPVLVSGWTESSRSRITRPARGARRSRRTWLAPRKVERERRSRSRAEGGARGAVRSGRASRPPRMPACLAAASIRAATTNGSAPCRRSRRGRFSGARAPRSPRVPAPAGSRRSTARPGLQGELDSSPSRSSTAARGPTARRPPAAHKPPSSCDLRRKGSAPFSRASRKKVPDPFSLQLAEDGVVICLVEAAPLATTFGAPGSASCRRCVPSLP